MADENNKNQQAEEDSEGTMQNNERSATGCEAERDEYLRGWQRAKADFANYKKEEAQRMEHFAKYHSEGLLREFLTVLDNFDLAISTMEKRGDVEKGIYLIRTQIEDFLRKYGIEKIPVARGEPFDPNIAEAIAEAASDLPEGSVLDEIEIGYKLHDKVIRPARVRVSKGTQQES